jgi:E3 ubiquitin-protein ligase SHPRH
LSQQWIDELTRHAPSLKVLLYPGWKSFTMKQKKKQKTKAVEAIDVDETNGSLLDSWPAYMDDFDVCVTTYDTLRQDLDVARAAPSRPVRQTAEYIRYKRPISPLVICEWYRVIMDEVWVTSFDIVTSQLTQSKVQMVGGGKASWVSLSKFFNAFFHLSLSEMVSLIPRLSSFAVSGTPAKTRVSDLHYVLRLRVL